MQKPIAQPCKPTRSQFKVTGLSFEFCVHSISPLPLGRFSLNFGQMFTSVGQCAEPITLDLHCLPRRGISGISRTRVKLISLELQELHKRNLVHTCIASVKRSYPQDIFLISPLKYIEHSSTKTCRCSLEALLYQKLYCGCSLEVPY